VRHPLQTELAAALNAVGFGPAASPFVRIVGGLDNQIWRFATADGRSHVLRIYRTGREQTMRREEAAIAAAAAAGVAVPVFEPAGVWHDRPLAVQPWLPGEPLPGALRSPKQVVLLGTSFGAVQAAIHQVPVPTALRSVSPDTWLGRCGPDYAVLETAVRALGVATDALIHLDYHPLNVLAGESGITAVLDWTNAAAGDRRADLARTEAFLAVAPLPGAAATPETAAARRALREAWWHGYSAAAGSVVIPPVFKAWAGAWLLYDLEGYAGEPDNWLQPEHLAPIRQWIERWSAQAGGVSG